MSEYLLLSVYKQYLEANGFQVEQKAQIPGGVVDILANSVDQTLLIEIKWVRSPGDVYEVVGRSVQDKVAMPNGTPVVVLPTGVVTEEIRGHIFGACYKYGIELHFVDINKRDVYRDYLTSQVFPLLQTTIRLGHQLLEQKLSRPQAKAVYSLLSVLEQFQEPLELIDDVKLILNKLKACI